MTSRRVLFAMALASIISAAASPAHAQTGAAVPSVAMHDSVVVGAIATDSESATFADSCATALIGNLGSAGFHPVERYAGTLDPAVADDQAAEAIHREGGARWVAIVRCTIERQRLIWRLAIFDFIDGAMIAADAQGTFAGLSAMPLLEASAARVAHDAQTQRKRVAPGNPIQYRFRFTSGDEGAQVAFGTGDASRPAGSIEDGILVAPFVAFREGDPVVITVAKDGYWPRTTVFTTSGTDNPIKLPVLMPMSRTALSIGLTAARLLGASADYRYYLLPDSIFLRGGDSLWLQYTYTGGSIPVLHDELRLGLGAYLFTPPYSRFRFAAGTGLSGIATLLLPAAMTDRFYFDLSLDAMWLSFEWHMPNWAVFMEQRVSYSFGLDSGLLSRGWLRSDDGLMGLTAGVMLKWP
ncbi:MAG TPA: hypothetical protein VMX33_03925 [bacterium]|nr:hypothetical protein [bacterium]